MSDPFLGEMRFMAFNFPPRGWATCSGQLLPINQNQALFSLLGTYYGGDGRVNFALPNVVGRVPIHVGNGFTQGMTGGEQAHTLTGNEMPTHVHLATVDNTGPASTQGNVPAANKRLSGSSPLAMWGAGQSLQPMISSVVGDTGGSQPHDNMMPYTVVGMCIALVGIFPSQN